MIGGRILQCGLAAAFLLSSEAVAAPVSNSSEKDSAPIILPLEGAHKDASWRTLPSPDEFSRKYPPLARLMEVNGQASITCDAETDGSLDRCHIDLETPPGLSFGVAALLMAPDFKMSPETIDGVPIKSIVTVPINFKWGGDSPHAPAADVVPPKVSEAALALARRVVALDDDRGVVTRKYESLLGQMDQLTAYGGRVKSSQAAQDAYRQGLQDALAGALEFRARRLASTLSIQDLSAMVAFLESSAGHAWVTEIGRPDETQSAMFNQHVAEAAHKRFCAQVRCVNDTAPGGDSAAK